MQVNPKNQPYFAYEKIMGTTYALFQVFEKQWAAKVDDEYSEAKFMDKVKQDLINELPGDFNG